MIGQKIVVLGTGGTLAGSASTPEDSVGYSAAQIAIHDIVGAIAPLRNLPIVTEQVAQIDSKDMTFDVWRALAQRCAHWLAQEDVAGLVITHGTDTLEETAFFLHSVLAPAKPVVITCAMRPATAQNPDGPQNLVDAVAVARAPGAQGVVAVCAGTIHGAVDIAKQHTYKVDAFGSGDAGPIGYVEEGALRLVRDWPKVDSNASQSWGKFTAAGKWPRVEIVMNYAGASGAVVDALLSQGVEGLVVAGTGNGTLHHELQAALLRAQSAGVKVLRSTRCAQGRVMSRSDDLLPHSGGLSPVKARIALMLELLG